MLPYWLMFAMWSVGAVQSERRRAQDSRIIFFVGAAIVTALMIGLRFQVGGDWGAYDRMYHEIYFLSFHDALSWTDMAYGASNWVAAQADLGIGFVNLVCGAIFMAGLARLAWKQPNPALAVLIAVPYLVIVVAMGYTRQAAAIGLICFAAADASEKHLVRLVVLVLLATLFHKTAVLMLPIFLVPFFRRNLIAGVVGAVFFAVIFYVALRGSSDKLITNYVQANYDSQGAAIRIAMNFIPAILFLILQKRFTISNFQRSFWTICSILSIAALPILFIASSSVGIDRISLYLIPLQVLVYSRISYLSVTKNGNTAFIVALVLYCFLVQFVWLNYADNSYYWVPYKVVLLSDE